ncbi:predicted protein [Histoplasma mississippiense (nom. inval.)]|uniref:predicted protein n=1 Tax=Ajellomyces capsulatus (strain NAm1 / WU24) TaxID=2059318 RepID=UPI000157CC98|nr:predicted protein [Histoplasma mississippiense (nom. inval.)]EDN10099.1 predicted protein [Histoplasma mississippiense (nom. inval.)]
MATVHSGRQGKPANLLKKGTVTTKTHRFESFSQRVVKLKIDPIHRVRRTSVGDDSDSDSDTYFRASLERWMELNLSENFTQFSQRVNRLCESLPQILHHEDRIMGLLAEYIAKGDEMSMEPLLSLVAQFSRDLGQRFERHFASAVTLVASVAATHSNIEVIEWSFTCLAWIFKFLSRLLVPDLRQLLGIMSPYLGKEKQKHFVTRFAAESMSFLVRKAALVYYKNKAPLDRAVTFLFEDLASIDGARQISMYQQGLMSMFADAIKGVNGGIHSSGADILRCLISAAVVQDETQSALAGQVLSGVVTNLVHHTSVNTFGSVLDVICDHVESTKHNGDIAAMKIDIRLVFVSVTARKGSRVKNWRRAHEALMILLTRVVKSSSTPGYSVQLLLAAVVVAVQTSPMDELLAFMRPIMELISDDQLRDYFLPFCSFFSTFGAERFQSVVLPYFQRGWKDAIVERLRKPNPSAQDISFLNSYTKLHNAISLSSEPSILPQLVRCLHGQLTAALAQAPKLGESQIIFARGQGFLAYVHLASVMGLLDLQLWRLIVSNGPDCANCPVFLEATLAYLSACHKCDQATDVNLEPFATILIHNLSSPSHEIRLFSLKILQILLSQENDGNNTYIEIAIEIEQSELTLHAARTLSMQVRKLAIAYPTLSSQKWLDRIIPNFCFGLLSKRLASLWDDACETIKAICEVRNGETVVAELAMRWLQEPGSLRTDASTPGEEPQESHISSDFECFNVSNIEKTSLVNFIDSHNYDSLLAEDFKSTHSTEVKHSTSPRTQALKVLGSVPQVAEKRSRLFVPLFLTWAAYDDDITTVNESNASGTGGGEYGSPSSWNLRDRKAMLDIFGKFVNPKVLYKAAEVHEALLGLLGNGDSEVQKSALKAIFTWKSPAIQPYETNILNLVDDARFRDELSVFLNVSQEANMIKEDHRADLLPVLLRLLYGKIVARGGSRGGQGTQEARRKTILRTISQLSENDFDNFIQISFGPLNNVSVLETDAKHVQPLEQEIIGVRKQYGLLKMVETMFETLKTKMSPFVERSMNVILYCLFRAALYFLYGNQQIIQRIVDCLAVESAREEVKIFVLNEILNSLISRADGEINDPENLPDAATTDLIRCKVLAPHVEHILTHVEFLLRSQSTRQLTMAAIETLSKLAPFVQSSQETTKLISTVTFLLNEPADRVPPKAKSGLLRVMQYFLPLYDPRDNVDLSRRIFEVISSLFDYFKDNPNRETLSSLEDDNGDSFFLPLIEHFVFDQEENDSAHNLAAEAVTTIGVLSEWLEWSQFRAIFRRYRGYVRSRLGMEKNIIRLLGQLTDGLSRAMNIIGKEEQPVIEDGNMGSIEEKPAIKTNLSKTLPAETRIYTELKSNFIPFLSEFVHQKDESEVHLRIPVAVITVKLLRLLPEEDMALFLPSLLLDLANVLKSRSQDARDLTRRTLADVALILGPSYFGYILKELRSTLTKGYQLHVLSFTVHSILVATSDHFEPGDLDQNLDALAAVVMDDIFGTVGQEKDAEEYVSKMQEVKSSKSYDSMELLAKISTIRHLSALINPVQALLREKLTAAIIRKVDELLRRIGIGLLRNPGAESRDLLVFCYEVIKESYKTEAPQIETHEQGNRIRFIVNLLNPRNRMNRGSTSSYIYKLSRFGLDVLRAVLNKHQSLMTAANVAGFLPIIGDAMLQSYEEVKLSAIRLLSTIIKIPLPELDRNSEVYLMEAIKMIKEAPNTNTEAAQAALKLIASILRELKSTKLKDSHLGYLLKRITADIEEPDRQGVTFNFIRAVMSRKFIVPEIYELVDNVAAMMVTNHTRSARDLARGVFVHFMIEYPQAKSRWTKQLGFLAKNLDYQHKEGRQCVMEAIHLLLSKTNGDPAQNIVSTFFIPVVMVMSNDDAVECREMAGVLLHDIFSRADSEQLQSMLSPLRSWLEQSQNPLLTTTGLQAIRIFLESDRKNKDDEVRFVAHRLPRIIGPAVKNREGEGWEVLYHSLQLFTKVCQLFPGIALSGDCENIWRYVCESLFYPHVWIKSCAANLIGIWLADEAKGNASIGYGSVPLISASGLKLEGSTMLDITRASLLCLKSATVSEDLATQTIRNLVFLGRCFSQNNLELSKKVEDLSDDVSNDSDESDNIDPAAAKPMKQNKPAIEFIFERAAAILRQEPRTTRADSLISKKASMKLLAALCTHLDVAHLIPSLQTILLPLLHLTDPSIHAPRSLDEQFQDTYKSLVSSSQEILDLLQKRLGTTDFVTQLTVARESVRSRREARRVKRRVEAVTDPEKFGREKKRKNDRKREKRKEKGIEYQERRRGW